MSDPIEDTLAELGLDTPDPAHLASLWGTLLAEPDVLAQWAHTSAHPRLAAAYGALHERVRKRNEEVRPHLAQQAFAPRLDAAAQDAADTAAEIEFELSRLKWLHANRSTRMAAADALGLHYDADADAEESDVLRELLHGAARGLC